MPDGVNDTAVAPGAAATLASPPAAAVLAPPAPSPPPSHALVEHVCSAAPSRAGQVTRQGTRQVALQVSFARQVAGKEAAGKEAGGLPVKAR